MADITNAAVLETPVTAPKKAKKAPKGEAPAKATSKPAKATKGKEQGKGKKPGKGQKKGKKEAPKPIQNAPLTYAEKTVKAGNKGTVAVASAEASNGTGRATIMGRSVSAVQRWCGAQGWTFTQVRGLLKALKLDARITVGNTRCQVADGKRSVTGGKVCYGEPAELTKAERAQLEALRPKVEAE